MQAYQNRWGYMAISASRHDDLCNKHSLICIEARPHSVGDILTSAWIDPWQYLHPNVAKPPWRCGHASMEMWSCLHGDVAMPQKRLGYSSMQICACLHADMAAVSTHMWECLNNIFMTHCRHRHAQKQMWTCSKAEVAIVPDGYSKAPYFNLANSQIFARFTKI